MNTEISNRDDLIDVREVIARIEELETFQADEGLMNTDALEELSVLRGLLSDLEGMGGDEQYKGVWYPVILIRESYFKDYAMELADEIGAVDTSAAWPMTCIDWDQAARELQMDYSSVEFDGVTYWTR